MTDTPMPPADAPQEPTVEPTAEPTLEPAIVIGSTAGAEPVAISSRPRKGQQSGWWWGTGRRKASVARVRIRPGQQEQMIVNDKPMDEFFRLERDQLDIRNVLSKTKMESGIEIKINVNGGGTTGQAGAIILGLARALHNYDPNLEPILRDNGFMTRDPRKVERKKPGQRGARRRFQFSKR